MSWVTIRTAAVRRPVGLPLAGLAPLWRHGAAAFDRALPGLFLILALPVMLFIALAVPPGQSPDEPNHVIRVASVLHGQIAGRHGAPVWVADHYEATAEVMANLGTARVTWHNIDPQHYYGAAVQREIAATPWAPVARPASVPNTATYPPFLYVPAALALGVMRLAGQSPYAAFIAERLANALFYAGIGALALALALRGKPLLFAMLVLPTALWLAGTVHPDGPMIALTALSVALLTGADHSRHRLWGAAACLALVILARPPLLPLALLIALPQGPRRSWGPVLLASLPGLLWMLLVVPQVEVPFYYDVASPGGPLWTGDPTRLFRMTMPAAQIHILLSHPGLLLTLPLASILQEWSLKLREVVGVVGALNLLLPPLTTWLGAAALLAGAVSLGRDRANARLPWIAAAAVATVLLIYDAQYVSWTHVGSARVQGVQGRYFIELVAFWALAGGRRAAPVAYGLPALALAASSLVALPLTILGAYYVK